MQFLPEKWNHSHLCPQLHHLVQNGMGNTGKLVMVSKGLKGIFSGHCVTYTYLYYIRIGNAFYSFTKMPILKERCQNVSEIITVYKRIFSAIPIAHYKK